MENNTGVKAIADRIKIQLTDFYTGNNWVTDNFRDKVLSINEEKAIKKMPGYSHSVSELVGHIVAWRNFVVQKLTGNDDYDIEEESKENWNDLQDWKTVITKFEAGHRHLLAAIETFPPGRWNENVPGRNYSFIYLICGIVHHDYYHYGQIGSVLAAINKTSK